MTYRNLTRDKLAEMRASRPPAMTPDGVWLDWPHSTKPSKPKKRTRTTRTGCHKVAKAFRPGSGPYS